MEALAENREVAPRQSAYDVIISGAGPVGLFLACELAQARCSVLILEKVENPHSPLKQLPFGLRGLNALSVEALYRRGLLPEFDLHQRVQFPLLTAAAKAETKPQSGGHFAGIPLQADKIDTAQWPYRLPGSTAPQLFTELREVETVLTRRAEALGVAIRRGLAISGLQQTASGVTVQAGDHSFAGGWLVGCDGSRSVVRKAVGFEFAGTEPAFTGYSAQVDIADPEQLKPGRTLTPTGMFMLAQPGYLILQDFDGGAFHQAQQPVTLARVQELTRRITGTDVTISALHLATTWTDRARQATTYRRGRVLLAGDAAHIHSPLGGQGLNLGLGDALNLGWKLAATIHGHAPAGLLDSYQAERHPLGAQVLDWSRAQVALMNPDPAARALHAIFRDLLDTRDGATYVAGRVWGISTQYALGGSHPLVGRSVPDFELANGPTVGELLRAGRGLLLDFEGDAFLKALAGDYENQLDYIAGSVKDSLAVSAVLVRPDGFVAWAAGSAPDYGELQRAAARWFACPAEAEPYK